MFPKYPYLDLSDRNLDFLSKAIREMENEVKNFVSLNAVKYANPIQWSINRQYEKNTIVIDPLTGTAFISVQPVPNGVSLTRTQYWTPVFDLSQFVTKAASNFANSYERDITTTATVATGAGDWVVWDSTLYVALTSIHAGDAYVVNGNIKRMTVEDFYDLLMEAIRALDDRIDDEIRDRQDADTALGGRIDDEIRDRQDADTELSNKIGTLASLNTVDKSNIVAAINEVNATGGGSVQRIDNLKIYNVLDYGAVGDGVTDDASAFQNAINDALANGGVVYIPDTTESYVIGSTLNVNSGHVENDTSLNVGIYGENYANVKVVATTLFNLVGYYGYIKNIHAVGATGYESFAYLDTSNYALFNWRFEHLFIENCVHAFYQPNWVDATGSYIVDCFWFDVNCRLTHGEQFYLTRSRGFITMRDVKVDETLNTWVTNWHAFHITDVIGLVLHDCDALGPAGSAYRGDAVGFWIEGRQNTGAYSDGTASIWLNNCNVDSTQGRGFVILHINFIHMNDCSSFATSGNGVTIQDVHYGTISNLFVRGANNAAGMEENGIAFYLCNDIAVNNLWVGGCGGTALTCDTCTNMIISNIKVLDGKNGIVANAASSSCVFANANITNMSTYYMILDTTTSLITVNSFINGVFHDKETGNYIA